MKRQITNTVSRLTVLVFAAITLCGCCSYYLEEDEAPMYIYVTCEKLGYKNEEILFTGYPYAWSSSGRNCVRVEEQNVYVHIQRDMIASREPKYPYYFLELTVISNTGYVKTYTEYPMVECECRFGIDNIDGTNKRYRFKQQEDSGKIIFTNIKEPYSKHNGKWRKLHLSGEFEVILTDVDDKTNTMTIRGSMKDNWINNSYYVEDIYNDSL